MGSSTSTAHISTDTSDLPAPAASSSTDPHAPIPTANYTYPPPPTSRHSAHLPTTSDPVPSHDYLPEICLRYFSRAGCEDVACRRLHLCPLLLAGICKFGTYCRNNHSLTTVRNQVIITDGGLGSVPELVVLQRLMHAFDRSDGLTEATYRRNLDVCFRYNSVRSCKEPVCHRLHICRHFVLDLCNRVDCKYGHNLHTSHNNGVLSRHRVTKLVDDDIMTLLKHNSQLHPPEPTAAGSGPVRSGSQRQQVRHGRQPQQHRRDGGADAGGAGAGGAGTLGAGAGEPGEGGTGAGGAGAGGADMSEELQCAVCLDLLHRASTLGCGHTFCADCVEQLRGTGTTCPVCRAPITTWVRSVTLDNIISNIASQQ